MANMDRGDGHSLVEIWGNKWGESAVCLVAGGEVKLAVKDLSIM